MFKNQIITYVFLSMLPILFIADIILGSVDIPLSIFHDILLHKNIDSIWYNIIFEMRLPRATVAIITGIALPISGLLMQTLFRNPLADPYVLGISTGASLGVAVFSLTGGVAASSLLGGLGLFGSLGTVLSAFIGSSLVMIIIVYVAPKVYDAASLLIIGIMLGSITSAVVSVLQYFANPQEVHAFILWTFGSFSGIRWNEIIIIIACLIPCLFIIFVYHKSLNALLLGDNYARGLGIKIKSLRLIIIICASILASILTAFTGPIGFIGMTVPHMARYIFKTTNHKILIIQSALIGANLMLICDIISQMPGYESTLPINTVTAIFGAPVVIFVIYSGRKSRIQY
jgi:iron complex transport system permease protein